MTTSLHTQPNHARQLAAWILTRGGLAIWHSINLSDPGASWTTPRLSEDGTPTTKPTWQAAQLPSRVITDMADVVVDVPKLVRRFRIALRLSSNGPNLKLTDHASTKVRKAVEDAGEGAWYEFDYCTQEACIFVPEREVPLAAFLSESGTEDASAILPNGGQHADTQ